VHCQFCAAALESIAALCPFCGSQVVLGNRYELRAVLGRGGTSEVFRAFDKRLQNDVALKRLSPQLASSQELRDSLTKEARVLARLSDRAIVRLFDFDEFSGDLYLVLEYVNGPTMREMLRNGYRAPVLELARIMEQMCKGLSVAHEAGVVHRDLKPGNLMLALHGGEEAAYTQSRTLPPNLANAQVKITDFGIAKAIADAGVTMTNAFSGTPGYMAPEQFRGEPASPETDVYALGVITYELLTGTAPKGGIGTIPGVHPAVAEVISKAMSPVRQYRFPSAAAFHEALCNAIEGKPPKRVLQPARRPAVHAARLALVAVVMGALAAVLTFVIVRARSGTDHSLSHVPNFEETPTPIDWRSIPRVTEPPPPVEDARGRPPDSVGFSGPQHPKVRWSVVLDSLLSMHHAALGKDGTVYVTGISGQVCALRDGKVLWAYKTGSGQLLSEIQFDDEGRVWFHSLDTVYCLNRDGKGGRLPPLTKQPEEPSAAHFSCTLGHELWGRGWKMSLEGNCSAQPVARPGGTVFVGLDLPQILAISQLGAVEWKYSPSCDPKRILPAPANRLVFTCEDNTIHSMTGSTETWSRTSDGTLYSDAIMDSTGTVFYGDYIRRSGGIHLHAIDAQGKDRWTFDMQGSSVSSIALGMQHQLIVSSSSNYGKVIWLTD
jgi:serine/threonine protein kinase